MTVLASLPYGGPPWGFGEWGGGPVIDNPTQLDANGTRPPSMIAQQIFLPEVLEIPDARDFNPEGDVTTSAIQANIEITGTRFTVPPNTFAVIRSVTLYITNMLTTTNVTYTLNIGTSQAQGYTNLKIFPRVAPFVGNGYDTLYRFQGGVDVFVSFSNNDGGTYVVGASYSGWFWAQASDERWRQFGR